MLAIEWGSLFMESGEVVTALITKGRKNKKKCKNLHNALIINKGIEGLKCGYSGVIDCKSMAYIKYSMIIYNVIKNGKLLLQKLDLQ